jgi:hypothetical protein
MHWGSSAMTSKPVALLLADLGVTKTDARPHVSNDNPFSEAQFKTLKYRPTFPERFGSIQDARGHCHVFFPWSRYAGDPITRIISGLCMVISGASRISAAQVQAREVPSARCGLVSTSWAFGSGAGRA